MDNSTIPRRFGKEGLGLEKRSFDGGSRLDEAEPAIGWRWERTADVRSTAIGRGGVWEGWRFATRVNVEGDNATGRDFEECSNFRGALLTARNPANRAQYPSLKPVR